MKALFLFLFIAMTSTPQVIGLNGVYFKQGNQHYVNLGWGTSLNSTQPYYNTIRQGSTVIANGYSEPYNRISIPVLGTFQSGTYSVTQTYNGVESAPQFVTITKIKK